MKKLFLAVILVLISHTIVIAQSKQESAVTKTVEQLRKAMIDPDKPVLEKLTADNLSYGHSSGKIENKASFIENIANGNSDFVTIDLSEQTISVTGKTAIVRHILKAKTNDGGKPNEVHLRILLVWQKQGSQWKLLARQAVKVT
jgi:ketosteroid isomerase-like protein